MTETLIAAHADLDQPGATFRALWRPTNRAPRLGLCPNPR